VRIFGGCGHWFTILHTTVTDGGWLVFWMQLRLLILRSMPLPGFDPGLLVLLLTKYILSPSSSYTLLPRSNHRIILTHSSLLSGRLFPIRHLPSRALHRARPLRRRVLRRQGGAHTARQPRGRGQLCGQGCGVPGVHTSGAAGAGAGKGGAEGGADADLYRTCAGAGSEAE
jgi:hypothetical protein